MCFFLFFERSTKRFETNEKTAIVLFALQLRYRLLLCPRSSQCPDNIYRPLTFDFIFQNMSRHVFSYFASNEATVADDLHCLTFSVPATPDIGLSPHKVWPHSMAPWKSVHWLIFYYILLKCFTVKWFVVCSSFRLHGKGSRREFVL